MRMELLNIGIFEHIKGLLDLLKNLIMSCVRFPNKFPREFVKSNIEYYYALKHNFHHLYKHRFTIHRNFINFGAILKLLFVWCVPEKLLT